MNHFNYFSDIEQRFVKRRGKHMLIGTLDWALIESWKEREIPLALILREIDEVFDKIEASSKQTSEVRSLSYCKGAVEKAFATWKKSQSGKRDKQPAQQQGIANSPTSTNIRDHLDGLVRKLTALHEIADPVLRPLINSFSGKLETLGDLESEFEIEIKLDDLDDELDSQLMTLKEQLLPDFDSKDLSDRHTAGVIRQKHKLPRLSLFKL